MKAISPLVLAIVALALLVVVQGAQASASKKTHYHYWAGTIHYTVTAHGQATFGGVAWEGSGSGSASLTIRFPPANCYSPCVDRLTEKSASLSYEDGQNSGDCKITVTGDAAGKPGPVSSYGYGLDAGRGKHSFLIRLPEIQGTEQTTVDGKSCPAGVATHDASLLAHFGEASVGGSNLHFKARAYAYGQEMHDYLASGAWRNCPVPVPGYMSGPWTSCEGMLTINLTYH